MKYTENELINCLENRLKWYQEALEYKRKSEFHPAGFTLPDGNFRTCEGAIKELNNMLDMMKYDSEKSEGKQNAKIYIEVLDGVVQSVYTDIKEDIEVLLCDHDDEEAEKKFEGFDQATKACKELRKNRKKLRHIF